MLKEGELNLHCMYYLKQSVTVFVKKNKGECLYVTKLYETQPDLNKRWQAHTNSHCKASRRNKADFVF